MSMAWIKVRSNLADDPKVVCIAEELQADRFAVVGRLVAFWSWADTYSVDGNALSVTSAFLDQHFCCMGLASAMRKVGWLAGQEGNLSIPGFDKHNSQSAKKRALTSERVKVYKDKKEKRKGNAASVTLSSSSSLLNLDGVMGKEIELPFSSAVFRQTWADFERHRSEIRKPLKPTSRKLSLQELAGMGEQRAIMALRHTIAKGWQGIREPEINERSRVASTMKVDNPDLPEPAGWRVYVCREYPDWVNGPGKPDEYKTWAQVPAQWQEKFITEMQRIESTSQ